MKTEITTSKMASTEAIQVDVVVIGAGPAGSTAARYLAMLGPQLKIALLDRQEWPRPKHCAGGLTKKMFAHFPEMFELNIYRGHARKLTAHGQKAVQITYHVPRIDSEQLEDPRCVSRNLDLESLLEFQLCLLLLLQL